MSGIAERKNCVGDFRRSVPCDLVGAMSAAKELGRYCLAQSPSSPAQRATAEQIELCVAEVLTNVVKYAFAEIVNQRIELRCDHGASELVIEIIDNGIELPASLLNAKAREFDFDNINELPEGGFGWFLIRSQMDEVGYSRQSGVNHLTLIKRFET